MLGTNDAKPANWSETGFVEDYHTWIAEFRDLGAAVYVATPPPVVPPGAFDIPSDVVNETLVPLVRQIALDAEAPLIDVYAALEGQPELFPDTVHPNAAGARLIAETVADVLGMPEETTTTSTQTTLTNSATTNSASSSTSSSAGGSSSAGLTASSAGLTSDGFGGASQQTAATSSVGTDTASSSGEPATSGPTTGAQLTSAQATLATASTDTGSGGASAGGAAAPSSNKEGCACKLGAPAPARHTAFWSLVYLAALSRRVQQRRSGGGARFRMPGRE